MTAAPGGMEARTHRLAIELLARIEAMQAERGPPTLHPDVTAFLRRRLLRRPSRADADLLRLLVHRAATPGIVRGLNAAASVALHLDALARAQTTIQGPDVRTILRSFSLEMPEIGGLDATSIIQNADPVSKDGPTVPKVHLRIPSTRTDVHIERDEIKIAHGPITRHLRTSRNEGMAPALADLSSFLIGAQSRRPHRTLQRCAALARLILVDAVQRCMAALDASMRDEDQTKAADAAFSSTMRAFDIVSTVSLAMRPDNVHSLLVDVERRTIDLLVHDGGGRHGLVHLPLPVHIEAMLPGRRITVATGSAEWTGFAQMWIDDEPDIPIPDMPSNPSETAKLVRAYGEDGSALARTIDDALA